MSRKNAGETPSSAVQEEQAATRTILRLRKKGGALRPIVEEVQRVLKEAGAE